MPFNIPIKPAFSKKRILFYSFLFFSCVANAQQADTVKEKTMEEVLIKAFEQNRKLKDVPAAINYVSHSTIEQFSPTSVLSAINTTPGLRMEERSPGSYRINIRGSSLRSPFGVRNVKIYFNDIPITDPGGNTYLNQLGYYNFNSIEIIKGPGSSLYGAGTGGVMLIESMNGREEPGALTEYASGSYNLRNIYVSVTTGPQNFVSRASFQHQENAGYRQQSSLKRDVHSWTGQFRFNPNKLLKVSFLYGDLFYETPGALTKAEYDKDPTAARPAGGGFPGSVAANASVHQREFISGASYEQKLSKKWVNRSMLYGMFTELRNPTRRNYGRSSEPHVGGRTIFKFIQPLSKGSFNLDFGGEWQSGFASVSIHKNVSGNPDSLRTFDQINNRQSYVFTQASLDLAGWSFTGGLSWNWMWVHIQHFVPATIGEQRKNFGNQIEPRFAVMKKLGSLNVYSSISKGFSPPSTAELLPTGGTINLGLNPEEGLNYDVGVKAKFGKLDVDVNAFLFKLRNTIVQRHDTVGGDYFTNAGKTRQRGVETYLGYPLFASSALINRGQFWISHTWHVFKYEEFKQFNSDFSGNSLPAEAPHTISTGFDFILRNGLLANLNYFFSDKIPLNDANSVYADPYHLVGLKLGYQRRIRDRWRIKIIAGVDNLL
ncbi:MAG: TonB-dependent receptor, partial [Flavisolibacter sp.]